MMNAPDPSMPPPPAGVPRRPSKRVLPPVPRETTTGPEPQQTQRPADAQPQHSETSSTAAAAAAAVPVAIQVERTVKPSTEASSAANALPPQTRTPPAASASASAATAAAATASAASASSAAASSAPVSSVPAAYTVPLWSAAPLYPFSLSVIKDGRELEVLPLASRSHFLLGRAADLCDITLDHLSVSRRHAVLQFHEHGSLWIMDLGTAHGTFRNKQRIPPNTFIELAVGDQIKFGASTRTYVVEGPDEFRPKEIDLEQIAQRQAAVQRQQVAAQQRLREEAKQAPARSANDAAEGGASWGMGEDAVDSEDDERDTAMTDDGEGGRAAVRAPSALPSKLTPLQQKWLDKLSKKKDKMQNLAAEVETLRGKDIRQGGLSEGQEKQIAKNEERMQALSTEIDELETQLQESIERVAGDREKNKAAMEGRSASAAGKKRRRGADSDDSQSDRSDDDDDFFDRTKSKLPKTASSGPKAAAPISAFIATLTPVEALTSPDSIAAELTRIEQKRDQLRHTLSEVVVQEAKSKRLSSASSSAAGAPSSDSLDSFMSGISRTQLSTRKDTLKTNLQELQAHYTKLQRLMEQRKGEIRVQAYRAGDAQAFARPAAASDAAAESCAPVPPAAVAAAAPSSVVLASAPAPSPRPVTASPAPAPAPPPVSAGGVTSTADMLARMKKKQEAHVRKLKEQTEAEDREAEEKASKEAAMPVAVITRASVQAFIAESAPKAPLDRYALLAAQLESARGHKNYSTVPDDDVSRALKARAAASANFAASTGLSANDPRGGLHVRRKEDGGGAAPASASHSASQSASGRVVGPSGPDREGLALQEAQHHASVEWTPPVASAAAGQDKLRAKFAGRY